MARLKADLHLSAATGTLVMAAVCTAQLLFLRDWCSLLVSTITLAQLASVVRLKVFVLRLFFDRS
jgi:hypothetical protein